MSTLIISTGNSPQAPFAVKLLESLRDPKRGAYTGAYLFVSDGLSSGDAMALENAGAQVLLFTETELAYWHTAIGTPAHPFGKVGKPAMVLEALRRVGRRYERVFFIDPDCLVQSPVESLFAVVVEGKVIFAPEFSQSAWTLGQFKRAVAAGLAITEQFTDPPLEINTGFWGGAVTDVCAMLEDWLAFMQLPAVRPMRQEGMNGEAAWHDQDHFRIYSRTGGGFRIQILENKEVVHLCNGAHSRYRAAKRGGRVVTPTGEMPVICHFAGASWVHFLPVVLHYLDIDGASHALWRHHHGSSLLSRLRVRQLAARDLHRLAIRHRTWRRQLLLQRLARTELIRLGSMAFFSRSWHLAHDCYRTLARRFSDEPEWLHMVVKLYTITGKIQEGRGLLARVCDSFAEDLHRRPYTYGLLHKNLGLTAAAAELFAAADTENPNFLNARFMLGGCLAATGDYDGAMACFEEVVGQDPRRLEAHLAVVDLFKYQNDMDAAKMYLGEVANLFPGAIEVARKRQQLQRLSPKGTVGRLCCCLAHTSPEGTT